MLRGSVNVSLWKEISLFTELTFRLLLKQKKIEAKNKTAFMQMA